MLSERKENQCDFSKVLESNRKSSSACRQILRDICQENQSGQQIKMESSREGGKVKEIKMKEAISYLQKKVEHQSEELIFLTDQIAQMKKERSEDLEFIKLEKEKSKKMQNTINNHVKTLADLRKKNENLQGSNKELEKKVSEADLKLFKMKEILRKKECQVSEMKEKQDDKGYVEEMIEKQKDELKSMRENYFKIKSRENDLEDENSRLKSKIQELQKDKAVLGEKIWGLEEVNKRLQDQCNNLEQIYEEEKKESLEVENQMKSIIEGQINEIVRLQNMTTKIRDIELEEVDKSVYWKEIMRVLKQNVHDRNLRAKLEKMIQDVVISMEEGWNKILMQVVASSQEL